MKYLTREDRRQIPLFVGCLEEAMEALPLGDFGFKVDHLENGWPAYHPVMPACPLRPLN